MPHRRSFERYSGRKRQDIISRAATGLDRTGWRSNQHSSFYISYIKTSNRLLPSRSSPRSRFSGPSFWVYSPPAGAHIIPSRLRFIQECSYDRDMNSGDIIRGNTLHLFYPSRQWQGTPDDLSIVRGKSSGGSNSAKPNRVNDIMKLIVSLELS